MPGNKAAQQRAAQKQAEIEERRRQEREARREAHRASSLAGMARAAADTPRLAVLAPSDARASKTFAQVIADQQLLEKTSTATRRIISETGKQVEQFGKASLKVLPSCHTCTAAKGCCKIATTTMLYEAVPIAERLRREGRDTPALRKQLEQSADAMETTRRDDYFQPCVFLDSNERCTIYEDRPSECGTAFVFSDPAICSSRDPNARIQRPPTPIPEMVTPGLEEAFVRDAGLRRTDHPYLGALPRMVLLCLQAWERTDYVEFLSEHGRRAAHRFARAIGTVCEPQGLKR
jgi:Fe-S-cluster containining protein